MSKIAFVFPGQGAQYIGMAKEISEISEAASRVLDDATDALGFDIRNLLFDSDEETLKITENTQPAILAASVACARPLIEAGIRADYTGGLSLGEYAAHVIAGSIDFKDAVRLVRKRGKYMQEAVPLGEGSMAAILGLSREDVLEICKTASEKGIVEPANFNCPGQIVIAGEVAAVNEAIKIATEKGARRAMLLNVSAPFHCSLLKPAGEKLSKELENVVVNTMNIPVVTNVTGKIIESEAYIKDFLIKQVSTSVLWEDCVRTLIENGADTFIEIGPGKVLSGFIKKIDKKVRILNVEDKASLDKTITALRGQEVQ
ncbi:MAG TPA: ACP S-malonyltransferase [Clostridiaceae bacterium]|jgi:[acyl-carrier-protein] S-malonyltransferase|nr:ACP S-malonyltransferase [Clostridiaceae bacterium]